MPSNVPQEFLSLAEKSIEFSYASPSDQVLADLKAAFAARAFSKLPNSVLVNSYRAQGLPGTLNQMYARSSVVERLDAIARRIDSVFGVMIFDAYRSLETQTALFNWMCEQVKVNQPTWTNEQVKAEARRFATDPKQRPGAVPPHNSGGAIDLALYDLKSGDMLNFGSEFDEPTDRSRTDFYEADFDPVLGVEESVWFEARRNRRILFHLMKDAGFTNYSNEWWHYDLGDCIWAAIHGMDWQYDSLQPS